MYGIKLNVLSPRMERIPSTMMIHINVDGSDIRFAIIPVPLVKNPLESFIELVIRVTCQASSRGIRWLYEPVSYFWVYVYPDSYSSEDNSG